MKKLIFTLFYLFSSITSAHETIHLYIQNLNYGMLINYQICALPFKNTESFNCEPWIQNQLLNKGQNVANIEVDNWAFYVRVISAYQLEESRTTRAYGEFEEEECKAFVNSPIILIDGFDHVPIIQCKKLNDPI